MHVRTPLILEKSFTEILKSALKNALSYVGFSYKGWSNFTKIREIENEDRLSPANVEEITLYSDRTIENYRRSLRKLSEKQIEETCESVPLPVVEEILSESTAYNAVVNIGCAYAKAEAVTCRRFPDVTWYMLDFTRKLEELNKELDLSNALYHSCYPLDWIEKQQDTSKFDIALFNRVLHQIPNAEIRSYLTILKRNTRYVVFGEVASLFRFLRSVNIDNIPVHTSLPCRGRIYVHNYRAILKEFGFEMIHYDTFRTPVSWHGEQHAMIVGAAKNKALV